ncbi:MAG: GNAT family N-acetyltransferase [Actinomycetota bacterium]
MGKARGAQRRFRALLYPRSVLRVRVATPDDIGVMLALWRELEEVQGPLRYFPSSPDAEERIMGSFRSSLDADDADVLIVEDGGDPVGMALVHIENPSRMSAEQAAELSRVVVTAGKRGAAPGKRWSTPRRSGPGSAVSAPSWPRSSSRTRTASASGQRWGSRPGSNG